MVQDCDKKCDCGTWGPLVVDNKKVDCGSRILWNCKRPFQITSSYQCNPNDESCQAKTTWEIKKGDVIIKTGTGTNNISDAISLTANGIYTLTLNATCNDIKCKPCTYTMIVEDCKEEETCECGTWGPLVVDNKKVDCGSRILWNCKRPFQFTSSYQCNPNDESCQSKRTWELKKGAVIIKTGSGINDLSDGFDLTAEGTYTLTLNATCNGIKCRPCTYTIVVEDCDKKVEPIQNTVLKYYYDLDKDPTYPYSEISNKTLNVQFVNNYASIESIQLNIYDVESKKLINPRTVNAHKLKGFNGLNRISIDLKDYNLEQGRLYLLVVSDFSSTYHFNFKITNDREK